LWDYLEQLFGLFQAEKLGKNTICSGYFGNITGILQGASNKKGAYCYAPNPDPDDPDPDRPNPDEVRPD